jgi:hypothetical protein
MRTLSSLLLTTLALISLEASAADKLVLSQLGTWRDRPVENLSLTTQAYGIVVRQLAASIMNAPVAPAETLGLNGFDVAFSNTWAFLSAHGTDINDPAPWERVHPEQDPTHVLWRPGVTIRKGLPLSLEVGANWSWIGFSEQTALGGFARWSVFEGYKKAPDVSMQLGYTGYIGNDELELGALDGSLSVGHTFPIGYLIGINQADLAPFIGVGFMQVNASPRLARAEQDALGISAVSGMSSKDSYKEGYSLVTTHMGLRVRSGDFHITTSGSIVAKALPTINMSVGLTY